MIKKFDYILNKKERSLTIILILIMVIGSFLEMAAVAIFSPYIELIMNPEVKETNFFIAFLYDLFNITDDTKFLVILSLLIMAIYIIKDVYTIAEKNLTCHYAYGIRRRLSTDLLSSYMKEPYTFHLNKNISILQRSLQADTEFFSNGILHFMEMVAEVFVCVVIFVYLLIISKSISIIVGGLLLLCMGVFYYISKKYSVKWGLDGQRYNAHVYQWMNQSIGGIKELKVLNREQTFIERYDDEMNNYARVLRYVRVMGAVPKYIIEMVAMTGMLLAIIVKLLYGKHVSLDSFVPELAIFAVAAVRLMPSMGRISEHLNGFINAIPSFDLIYNDLKEVENVPDFNNRVDNTWKFKDTLKLQNVTFHYPDGDVNVLDGVNLEIKRGQTVAFIGSSGSGKSTMIDVILGLLKPVAGQITADGLDIVDNLPTWQKEIGYIPQTIYLSDDTVRNNIAFGVPENEIDDAKIEEALKGAQLYDFVEALADGVQTMVGDRGVRLSGGQRQRIGIARALYHNPEVLVLDEATSALDGETEAAVMDAIDRLKGQKTILIIAHRLTTIQNADLIYEVVDGQVISKSKEEVL